MAKKNIEATFSIKQPLENGNIQVLHWSGNHWDNISYFPKNYQIACVRAGKGEIIVGDEQYPVHAGQFFLIYPKRIHSGKPDFSTGWEVDALVIKPEYIQSLFKDKHLPIFKTLVYENDDYLKLFDACLQLLENDFELTLEHETKLIDFLFQLLSIPSVSLDYQTVIDENEAVNRAIDYIEKHYKTAFSLEDLIEKAYLSKFHLIRIFKKQTGLTPHAYQMQLRLNEARKLIFQDKSLTEIAYDLGFADQAHFTNTFKKYANGANPRDVLKTAIFFNFEE
jgi:AraC-like DNA-binding protein